jgi:hypothetical protein
MPLYVFPASHRGLPYLLWRGYSHFRTVCCRHITRTYITLRKLAIASIFELRTLISFHTHLWWLPIPSTYPCLVILLIHSPAPRFHVERYSSFMCRNCPVLLNPSHPSPVIKQHVFTFALHTYSFVFPILFTNNLYIVVTSHLVLFSFRLWVHPVCCPLSLPLCSRVCTSWSDLDPLCRTVCISSKRLVSVQQMQNLKSAC